MSIGWHQPIANYVGDQEAYEWHLFAIEYSGLMPMQGEDSLYVEGPRKLKHHKFKVEVAQDRGPVWRIHRSKDEVMAVRVGGLYCAHLPKPHVSVKPGQD